MKPHIINDAFFKVVALRTVSNPVRTIALLCNDEELNVLANLNQFMTRADITEILSMLDITFTVEGFPHDVAVQARTHRIGTTFDVQCLSGDTLISVSNGTQNQFKKLSDLYTLWSEGRNHMKGFAKEIVTQQKIIKQSKIVNMNEDTKELAYTQIENMFYGGKKELFKVTLNSGKSVDCSMEHRLLTTSGWRRLKDISIGDKLFNLQTVYPERQKGFEVPYTEVELNTEKWLPVVGFEEKYSVSSLGRIKNLKTGLPKTAILGQNGYYSVGLWKDNKEKRWNIHRIVLEAFSSMYPGKGYEARHLDSNPWNNRIQNLQWGTVKEWKIMKQLSLGL